MPDGRRFQGWERGSYEAQETRRLRLLGAGKVKLWDSLPGFIVERRDVFPGWDEPMTVWHDRTEAPQQS